MAINGEGCAVADKTRIEWTDATWSPVTLLEGFTRLRRALLRVLSAAAERYTRWPRTALSNSG
jgi:protein gp37